MCKVNIENYSGAPYAALNWIGMWLQPPGLEQRHFDPCGPTRLDPPLLLWRGIFGYAATISFLTYKGG
jgi:hypothetical protein